MVGFYELSQRQVERVDWNWDFFSLSLKIQANELVHQLKYRQLPNSVKKELILDPEW